MYSISFRLSLERNGPFSVVVPSLDVFFSGLQLEALVLTADGVTLTARSAAVSVTCPRCGHLATRVHSSYQRAPRDRSLADLPLRLQLAVRRFRCDNADCPAVTFAERFGAFLKPSVQRTERLRQALLQLGLALGGAAGARMSRSLHMPASRDTLLRLVRRLPQSAVPTPRVLGVDDFALRKGQRYGTILLDLEQRRPIDLLPERSASLLETWLQQHPSVEIIARDRGTEYIRGATAGAPHAIQVADRFHLLCNLREALERTLDRAHRNLRVRLASTPHTPDSHLPSAPVPLRRRKRTGTSAAMPQERRARRFALYEQVRLLYQEGRSKRHIAQELSLSPWLVRRFVQAKTFPERAPKPPRPTILTPFEPLLYEHWRQGERTTTTLFRLLQAAGYTGSIYTVRHWVQGHRQEPAPRTRPAYRARYTVTPAERAPQAAAQRRLPSARQLVWLILNDPEEHDASDQELLDILLQEPSIARSYPLAQRFLAIVRQREIDSFGAWLNDCLASGVRELANFANGLQQDEAAVRAALTLPWSTGQVEGHITRLKLVKRQMYGRASFELLRQRVLHRT